MTADPYVADMARVALTALSAGLRWEREHHPGIRPRPVVTDAVIWLAMLANSAAERPPGFVNETTLDLPTSTVPPSAEITVADAARRLKISPQAVRKQLAAGSLTGHKLGRVWIVEWTEEAAHGGLRADD